MMSHLSVCCICIVYQTPKMQFDKIYKFTVTPKMQFDKIYKFTVTPKMQFDKIQIYSNTKNAVCIYYLSNCVVSLTSNDLF